MGVDIERVRLNADNGWQGAWKNRFQRIVRRGASALLIAGLLGGFGSWVLRPKPGAYTPSQDNAHVISEPIAFRYASDPPTSGPHFAGAATEAEALLEALERGPGPSKGRPDASVTIVEFSDFQCTYCRKFWRETLPRIEGNYIRAGKVRFVYRHLAILGPPSVQAAIAAECAHEQDRFWPYHDRLFSSVGLFTFTTGNLKRYAEELRLDAGRFNACLDAERPREKVEQETIIGRMIGMTGTPGFLINGGRLVGAQPYEVFEQIIDKLLEEARTGRTRKP
jgi:protein-disulfide isomerase